MQTLTYWWLGSWLDRAAVNRRRAAAATEDVVLGWTSNSCSHGVSVSLSLSLHSAPLHRPPVRKVTRNYSETTIE